jgi:uncharacterized membrane protein
MGRTFTFALLLTLASTCSAQFTFAPIDVPGAVATVARGINNSGQVAGFYQTVACSNYDRNVPSCATKGFKLLNGAYVKLMVPNSTATAIMGVNDLGDLVGFYTKADGTRHGFIWYHQNIVKTIDYPGLNAPYFTVPMGIDKAGTVVGGVWSISSTGTFSSSGWVWVNGTFTAMNPGGTSNGTCCQSVNGISNNGIIVGQVFLADFWQAWLKESTDNDFWEYQNGDSFAEALDTNTDVAGYSTIAGGWFAQHIEAGEGSGDSEGTINFVVVNYPNSQLTIPFGMNDSRYLAGTYVDSSGKQHGFIAKPAF